MAEDGFLDLMKEEHLDTLISLAFQLDSARIIEQLEKESEQAFSSKEEQITRQAMVSAYEKLRQQELNAYRSRGADRRHRRLMRAIEILACIVLVIGISAPVAVANIETLRLRIMEFLVSFDTEKESADIQYSDETSIPADWEGEYYPTFLPEETLAGEIDPIRKTKIVFTLDNNATIIFSENDSDGFSSLGTENEDALSIDINGNGGQMWEVYEQEHYIRMIWDIDERWFMLETKNLDQNIVHMIAESVKKKAD